MEEEDGLFDDFDSEGLYGICRVRWDRWERGAEIQSRTADNYLRFLFGKETTDEDTPESSDLQAELGR